MDGQESPTTRTGVSPELHLQAHTPNGRARDAALKTIGMHESAPASLVSYRSAGHLLIIGEDDHALSLASSLKARVACTVLVTGKAGEGGTGARRQARRKQGHPNRVEDIDGIHVMRGRLSGLTGHLGHFNATLETADRDVNLARGAGHGAEHFDLVLDLKVPGTLQYEMPPPGYYAPGRDRRALEHALEEIPEMVGEFEKPKFFHYNPDICAHGANGIQGCTRCLDACPTLAITSNGDKLEIDPYLCQGGGSCATACPSGAITYVHPSLSDVLGNLRTALKGYREAGGQHPYLLFHDRGAGRQTLVHIARNIPEYIIPFEIEEVGAVGMDTWLAALAYGASRVILLATPAITSSVMRELYTQLEFAAAILEGMGFSRERIQLVAADDATAVLATLNAPPTEPDLRPASFAAMDDKRTSIRLAVDYLFEQAPAPKPLAALPAGAPFGEIKVDREACTLCMACVSVCPASALSDGADLPQLLFHEWNCVQCGMCEIACPENAITRAPRFIYDLEMRRATRILNEEEPFCCIVCGKPFATRSIVDAITVKLKHHWMFQDPHVIERLQMCEDCRLKDMFIRDGGAIDTHKRP